MTSKVKVAELKTSQKTVAEGPISITTEVQVAEPLNLEVAPLVQVAANMNKSEQKSKPKKSKKAKIKVSSSKLKVEKQSNKLTIDDTTKASVVQEKKVEAKKNSTIGQNIWNNVRSRELGLFGLKGQTVEMHCKFVPLDPNRCFMLYDVSSVVPALEKIAPEYDLELITKYVVLTRKFSS